MTIKKLLESWKTMALVGAAVASIVTTAFAVDKYYAKDKELHELVMNFEEYKTEERTYRLQEKIWQIEDRIAKEGNKPELVERLRELKYQYNQQNNKLNQIQSQKPKAN